MAVSVGLEVTDKRVNVVVVEGSAKAARLRFAFSEEIGNLPEGMEEREFRSARLTEILKKYRTPRANVVCSLPVQDVFAREVVVPFVKEDQIRKTIKFEAEEYLPGTRADDMVVDFYKIGQIEQKSRVLVIAAKKDKVREFLTFLLSSAIEPAATGLDAAYLFQAGLACGALSNAAESPALSEAERDAASPRKETQEGVALHPMATFVVALSEDRVCLVLAEDERLRRIRGFRLGENENAAEKLVREINRTFAAAHGLSSIRRVHLSGARATPALASELSTKLGSEVSLLEFSCVFKDAPTDEQKLKLVKAGGVALGSALAGLGADRTRINFRRDEFAYQKAFEKLKKGLACTACLLFFICFLLCYCFQFRLSQNKHLLALQRSFAQNIFQSVALGKKTRGGDVPSIYQSYAEEMKARKSGRTIEKAPAITSALEIFEEIASFVVAKKTGLQLVNCDIDQNSVRVVAIVSTQEEGEAISAAIDRESKYLSKESSSHIPTKDGRCQFTYRFAVKQPKESKKQ